MSQWTRGFLYFNELGGYFNGIGWSEFSVDQVHLVVQCACFLRACGLGGLV